MKVKVKVSKYLTPEQRSKFYQKKNSRLAGRLIKLLKAILS
ncbi:hypothetical protein SAMN04487970_10066 [Paenibacillus tianmuensis]|uniref:Uncharacterized protein n=1 Tax=Paenibacillus tianmuensis TaxID=624147 RepID=A0A1G4Q994_9BACL|nr:hypothetical protein SAMN04487970_10066 [Paenibacillus tianmuensis]